MSLTVKTWSSAILPFVMAAVRVVLPWSTWPMVPMFTWGFSLLYVFFASAAKVRRLSGTAHYKTRTNQNKGYKIHLKLSVDCTLCAYSPISRSYAGGLVKKADGLRKGNQNLTIIFR